MFARLDYQWHLRQVMATRGMFSTTDLLGPLSNAVACCPPARSRLVPALAPSPARNAEQYASRAARDGQGRPLCPYCLVSDPVNLEECVRCRRRRQVSTRMPEGPVCATCNPPGILTCSSCRLTAVPCTVSKVTGQPRCGACARSRARCSRCGQLAGPRRHSVRRRCAETAPSRTRASSRPARPAAAPDA